MDADVERGELALESDGSGIATDTDEDEKQPPPPATERVERN